MCSSVSPSARLAGPAARLAALLTVAIDDCAAAVRQPGAAAEPEFARRVAAVWAILADADPDLAARAARYSGL